MRKYWKWIKKNKWTIIVAACLGIVLVWLVPIIGEAASTYRQELDRMPDLQRELVQIKILLVFIVAAIILYAKH